MNSDNSNSVNPLSKKMEKILGFQIDQETLNSLKNVAELVPENTLNTRRNLRANIEKQSLIINEQFMKAFQSTYENLQQLSKNVDFIDKSCQNMMDNIEVLKYQTSDFFREVTEVNGRLNKLDSDEQVLKAFLKEYQLEAGELMLINSQINTTVDDRFFDVLERIQAVHCAAKTNLASNQYVTGFEIMDGMTKYEEMACDKLYRWTIGILRSVNVDTIDTNPSLLRAMSHLQAKPVLFKHCLDELTTVRRSAVSHSFIETLTRGRTVNNIVQQPLERYSNDILKYIGDMLAYVHQAILSEKDIILNLLRKCNREVTQQEKTVETTLSSIADGLIRPLKIRIENCLTVNQKSVSRTQQKPNEKCKNYFLVKNIVNFYLQTFARILLEESSIVFLLRELLLQSDKVFYNSLSFYCTFTVGKLDSTEVISVRGPSNITVHLNEFCQLTNDLLEIIKSSLSNKIEEQKVETLRILTVIVEAYKQYIVIYSSRLSSIEMTIFSFNATNALYQIVGKHSHTEVFVESFIKQLDDYLEVLVNEQFQHIINGLGISFFYNVLSNQSSVPSAPLSSFSGCDHIAISNFLKLWNKFMDNPKSFQLPEIEQIRDVEFQERLWNKTLITISGAYSAIYSALVDPKNNYTQVIGANDIVTPERVSQLCK